MSEQSADDLLYSQAGQVLTLAQPSKVGVAVSGGSDSIATLNILAGAARARGVSLAAVTINHGLRPEAEAEAEFVAKTCASLGLRHDTRRWDSWSGAGNLQAEARRARYSLIAQWAKDSGVDLVALGHTRDDQAETLLMRLGRAAGVDGLAEMERNFTRHDIRFTRPFLDTGRAALRAHLLRAGLSWMDDPSNEDPQFDRVKARKLLAALEMNDITASDLATTARHMSRARDALNWMVVRLAGDHVQERAGGLEYNGLDELPEELARRFILSGLRWITDADYPPRSRSISRILDASQSETMTLAGCVADWDGGVLYLHREGNAVRDHVCAPDALWDQRWRINGPFQPGHKVRALGVDGLAQLPDWRASKLRRTVLLVTPSIWLNDTLVSAPLAGISEGWSAQITEDFAAFLLRQSAH
ncbi:MAG: tRNA lysidine(34) synthetase TilS [Pseudomonadota bacterium]